MRKIAIRVKIVRKYLYSDLEYGWNVFFQRVSAGGWGEWFVDVYEKGNVR